MKKEKESKLAVSGSNQYIDNDKYYLLEAAFKGLASALPYIGAVTSVIADIQAKRKQDRLIEFMNTLRLDVDTLKNQINTKYTDKDDFLDVFETTIKYTINERSEEKRLYYKNILKNSIIDVKVDYDKTEKYLRIIDSMDELELLILKIFDNPIKYNQENGYNIVYKERIRFDQMPSATEVLRRLLPQYSREDITIAWNDLESRWLINVSSTPPSTESILGPLDILENRLLKKGRDLVNFILK